MFADSAKKDIDTLMTCGRVRSTDAIWSYIYKRDYYILIWEINALNHVELEKILIQQGSHLDDVELIPGETLDYKSFHEEEIRLGPFFKDIINIKLDDHSEIITNIKAKNYRGFYASIKRIAFADSSGDILAMIHHLGKSSPSVVLLYKANNSFYIIFIDGDKPFDQKITSILNLQ